MKNSYQLKNFVTVIFSKDRPLQLDLTLTTFEKYSLQRNIGEEYVIYKSSDERYEKNYLQVAKEHPNIKFIKETTFKLDLCKCIQKKEHVLFLVDDCIFTNYFSIKDIHLMLSICQGALGFSLRLGNNTKYCYSLNIDNNIPITQPLGNNIIAFNWKETGPGDFSYPLEVSSSVYNVNDIKPILEGVHYSNPNQLEWMMYLYVPNIVYKPFLLFYNTSVAFCNPINKVQTENNNRVGINPKYTTENLLNLYEAGYRIDYKLFDGFVSNACHEERDIDFIKPIEYQNEYK